MSSSGSASPGPSNVGTPKLFKKTRFDSSSFKKTLESLRKQNGSISRREKLRLRRSFIAQNKAVESKLSKTLSKSLPSVFKETEPRINFLRFKSTPVHIFPRRHTKSLKIKGSKLTSSTSLPAVNKISRSKSDATGSKLSIKQKLLRAGRLKNSIIVENEDQIIPEIKEQESEKSSCHSIEPDRPREQSPKDKHKLKSSLSLRSEYFPRRSIASSYSIHSQSARSENFSRSGNFSRQLSVASSSIQNDLNILFYTDELPESSLFQFSPPIDNNKRPFNKVYDKESFHWMHVDPRISSRKNSLMESSTFSEPCKHVTKSLFLDSSRDDSELDEPEYCEVIEDIGIRRPSLMKPSASSPLLTSSSWHYSGMKVSPVPSAHSSEGK